MPIVEQPQVVDDHYGSRGERRRTATTGYNTRRFSGPGDGSSAYLTEIRGDRTRVLSDEIKPIDQMVFPSSKSRFGVWDRRGEREHVFSTADEEEHSYEDTDVTAAVNVDVSDVEPEPEALITDQRTFVRTGPIIRSKISNLFTSFDLSPLEATTHKTLPYSKSTFPSRIKHATVFVEDNPNVVTSTLSPSGLVVAVKKFIPKSETVSKSTTTAMSTSVKSVTIPSFLLRRTTPFSRRGSRTQVTFMSKENTVTATTSFATTTEPTTSFTEVTIDNFVDVETTSAAFTEFPVTTDKVTTDETTTLLEEEMTSSTDSLTTEDPFQRLPTLSPEQEFENDTIAGSLSGNNVNDSSTATTTISSSSSQSSEETTFSTVTENTEFLEPTTALSTQATTDAEETTDVQNNTNSMDLTTEKSVSPDPSVVITTPFTDDGTNTTENKTDTNILENILPTINPETQNLNDNNTSGALGSGQRRGSARNRGGGRRGGGGGGGGANFFTQFNAMHPFGSGSPDSFVGQIPFGGPISPFNNANQFGRSTFMGPPIMGSGFGDPVNGAPSMGVITGMPLQNAWQNEPQYSNSRTDYFNPNIQPLFGFEGSNILGNAYDRYTSGSFPEYQYNEEQDLLSADFAGAVNGPGGVPLYGTGTEQTREQLYPFVPPYGTGGVPMWEPLSGTAHTNASVGEYFRVHGAQYPNTGATVYPSPSEQYYYDTNSERGLGPGTGVLGVFNPDDSGPLSLPQIFSEDTRLRNIRTSSVVLPVDGSREHFPRFGVAEATVANRGTRENQPVYSIQNKKEGGVPKSSDHQYSETGVEQDTPMFPKFRNKNGFIPRHVSLRGSRPANSEMPQKDTHSPRTRNSYVKQERLHRNPERENPNNQTQRTRSRNSERRVTKLKTSAHTHAQHVGHFSDRPNTERSDNNRAPKVAQQDRNLKRQSTPSTINHQNQHRDSKRKGDFINNRRQQELVPRESRIPADSDDTYSQVTYGSNRKDIPGDRERPAMSSRRRDQGSYVFRLSNRPELRDPRPTSPALTPGDPFVTAPLGYFVTTPQREMGVVRGQRTTRDASTRPVATEETPFRQLTQRATQYKDSLVDGM